MAASTVIVTKLVEDRKRVIIRVVIDTDGDGTEISDSEVFNLSDFTIGGTAASVRVMRIQGSCPGFLVELTADGVTDKIAAVFGGDFFDLDFSEYGGIPQDATTPTGDFDITTTGMDAAEGGFFIAELKKIVNDPT